MIDLPHIDKELRVIRVADLKPYGENPRHNNKSAKMVAKSIKEYGYINPIVVCPHPTEPESYMILAGHTRLKALRYLGLTNTDGIEVMVVTGLSEKQIHGFVIADNRAGEYSLWNYSALDRLMTNENADSDTLKEMGMSSFKDTKKELEDLING